MNTEAYARRVEGIMEKRLDYAANLLVTDIKDDMRSPKSGKPVPKGQGSRGGRVRQQTTRAAKGESPAVQTARLRNSITQVRKGKLTRRVGTNIGQRPTGTPYGAFHEFGEHPWLRVGLKRMSGKIKRTINRKIP